MSTNELSTQNTQTMMMVCFADVLRRLTEYQKEIAANSPTADDSGEPSDGRELVGIAADAAAINGGTAWDDDVSRINALVILRRACHAASCKWHRMSCTCRTSHRDEIDYDLPRRYSTF